MKLRNLLFVLACTLGATVAVFANTQKAEATCPVNDCTRAFGCEPCQTGVSSMSFAALPTAWRTVTVRDTAGATSSYRVRKSGTAVQIQSLTRATGHTFVAQIPCQSGWLNASWTNLTTRTFRCASGTPSETRSWVTMSNARCPYSQLCSFN